MIAGEGCVGIGVGVSEDEDGVGYGDEATTMAASLTSGLGFVSLNGEGDLTGGLVRPGSDEILLCD